MSPCTQVPMSQQVTQRDGPPAKAARSVGETEMDAESVIESVSSSSVHGSGNMASVQAMQNQQLMNGTMMPVFHVPGFQMDTRNMNMNMAQMGQMVQMAHMAQMNQMPMDQFSGQQCPVSILPQLQDQATYGPTRGGPMNAFRSPYGAVPGVVAGAVC